MKIFIFIALNSLFLHSSPAISTEHLLKDRWDLSKTQREYLLDHKVLALSDVNTDDAGIQHFKLKAAALHKKTCTKVLRKLSMLEEYHNLVSFIKSSTYDEKSKLFTIKADHPVLPYPMIVHIIVDRPTKMGIYHFVFPTGMFRGLKGYFEITETNKKCLFFATSTWSGKKDRLPDFVIELFSETLSKLGGELLMRKT